MKNEFHICFVKYFLEKIKLSLGPSPGRHSAHHVLFVQGDQNIQNLLFFFSSLFLQDENMRRGKTKAKMKNVSDTLEHSNIFGSNIQSIKRSDLNYFTVFCLNFIMNSQIPLKSFKLCFNKITPDLKMNLFAFIFSVLFDV